MGGTVALESSPEGGGGRGALERSPELSKNFFTADNNCIWIFMYTNSPKPPCKYKNLKKKKKKKKPHEGQEIMRILLLHHVFSGTDIFFEKNQSSIIGFWLKLAQSTKKISFTVFCLSKNPLASLGFLDTAGGG